MTLAEVGYALRFSLAGFRFEKASRLDGRRRAHPCRGDDLPEVRVGRFPRREDAWNTGLHSVVDLDVTKIAHLQLALEHFRIWRMTNEDEQTIRFIDRFFAGLHIFQPQCFKLVRSDHFRDDRIQDKVHFGVLFGTTLQKWTRPKFLAAMDD